MRIDYSFLLFTFAFFASSIKATVASESPVRTVASLKESLLTNNFTEPGAIYRDGSNSSLTFVSQKSLPTNNTPPLACDPKVNTHIEFETTNSGWFWSGPGQVTSCLDCRGGDGNSGYQVSHTVGWTITFGTSMSYPEIENALPNPSFGVTYTDTTTYGQTVNCDCNPQACVKEEHKVVWVETHNRQVTQTCSCSDCDIEYGEWGGDNHAEMPASSDDVTNFKFDCYFTGAECGC